MNFKHGMYGTPTWFSWSQMHRRCAGYTPVHKKHYTDKGIKVCERWADFNLFLADMGVRPDGKTLDRIDVRGDYCPSNCRWATHQEQMQNRSNSSLLTFEGETKTVSRWARELGMSRATIEKRLKSGWPVEQVLSTRMFHELKGRRPRKAA